MEYFGKNPPIVVWKKLLLEDFYCVVSESQKKIEKHLLM